MTTKPRSYEYPVLPLKNVVVFPKTVVTLIVGREKSIAAVEDSGEHDRRILVVTQREVDLEDPKPHELYTIGTLAEIMQIHRQPDGNVQIVVEGIRRISLTKFVATKPFLRAQAS